MYERFNYSTFVGKYLYSDDVNSEMMAYVIIKRCISNNVMYVVLMQIKYIITQ